MLHWLYLDLNSFFASCEQQDRPELRGKPVAVVPLMADTTFCIAASYEAKAFGVKTGTRVSDAKAMCPGIQFVTGGHKRYVQYHHKVLEAVDQCIPVDAVMSIDEVACRLDTTQQSPEQALKLAKKIKQSIYDHAGAYLKCSIGIAPNRMLAKLATDMQKPNGLVMLQQHELPQRLYSLKLNDFPGIGNRMLKRLNRFGIYDVQGLYAISCMQMRAIWGGVGGARFHATLRGDDLETFATQTRVMSHQHVLEPHQRHSTGGLNTAKRLLEKACERLRTGGYYATRLSLNIKLVEYKQYRYDDIRFAETQNTGEILGYLEELWLRLNPAHPFRVDVALHGLVKVANHQLDMFAKPRNEALLKAVDTLNLRYGRDTVNFGYHPDLKDISGDKIAFQRVPKLYEAR